MCSLIIFSLEAAGLTVTQLYVIMLLSDSICCCFFNFEGQSSNSGSNRIDTTGTQAPSVYHLANFSA